MEEQNNAKEAIVEDGKVIYLFKSVGVWVFAWELKQLYHVNVG